MFEILASVLVLPCVLAGCVFVQRTGVKEDTVFWSRWAVVVLPLLLFLCLVFLLICRFVVVVAIFVVFGENCLRRRSQGSQTFNCS